MGYFDLKVDEVVEGSWRAVRRATEEHVELPQLAPRLVVSDERDRELARALGVDDEVIEFVWSVTGFTVEPRVALNAQRVFGAEALHGVSLAHHIAWRELAGERARGLLALLDPRHPVRANGILIPNLSRGHGVTTPWTIPFRVVTYLQGRNVCDAMVGGIVEPPDAPMSRAQHEVVDTLRGWLCGDPTIIIDGAHGSGRHEAIASALPTRRAVVADFAQVATSNAEATLLAVRREALLCDAVPVLANLDELWSRIPPGDELQLALASAIDRVSGPLVITTSMPGLELRPKLRTIVRIRWPLPDATTRRALWQLAIGEDSPELDLVAHRYELGWSGITAAVRSARQHDASSSLPALVAGVQDNIAERLGDLAKRVEIVQRWDELVLPSDTRDDVEALIGRVRHGHFVLDQWGFRRKLPRGAGVAALFSGPPGTGKTMVAGLIASRLQLELYQVDLSRIVSKWVGETEKQLAKVFEAAEAGHALLLFDEADSLFAKRSAEVKSATDRYANLEVNYLLQRVESFGGVVILTTNLDASIDPALRRRLASHIVFAAPEVDERVRLWSEMLATGAPHGQIDMRKLAVEYAHMTGAHIRNAVLTAAFLAAEEGTVIGEAHLHRGARIEYRAMGRGMAKGNM